MKILSHPFRRNLIIGFEILEKLLLSDRAICERIVIFYCSKELQFVSKIDMA